MIMYIGTFIIKEVSTVIVTSVLLHFLDGLGGSILGLFAISALCVHELHNSFDWEILKGLLTQISVPLHSIDCHKP